MGPAPRKGLSASVPRVPDWEPCSTPQDAGAAWGLHLSAAFDAPAFPLLPGARSPGRMAVWWWCPSVEAGGCPGVESSLGRGFANQSLAGLSCVLPCSAACPGCEECSQAPVCWCCTSREAAAEALPWVCAAWGRQPSAGSRGTGALSAGGEGSLASPAVCPTSAQEGLAKAHLRRLTQCPGVALSVAWCCASLAPQLALYEKLKTRHSQKALEREPCPTAGSLPGVSLLHSEGSAGLEVGMV